MIKRLVTGFFLIPLVLIAIYLLSRTSFNLAVGFVVLIAAWEWCALSRIKHIAAKLCFVTIVALLLVISFLYKHLLPTELILYMSFFWWLLAAGFIFYYQFKKSFILQSSYLLLPLGAFILTSFWYSLDLLWVWQNSMHAHLLIYPIALVAAADIGAYFMGKFFGKHKLAINVSPGKTWEGVLGGLMMVAIVCGLTQTILHDKNLNLTKLSVLVLMAVFFSVVGDLFESLLKREVGLKDSGKILPGHGGILDRIDGLLAFIPIFSLYFLTINNV